MLRRKCGRNRPQSWAPRLQLHRGFWLGATRRGERVTVERAGTGGSIVEVLDHVLDKGIVIDAWVRVALIGIDLITVEARVVVASIQTYLESSEALALAASGAAPAIEAGAIPAMPTPHATRPEAHVGSPVRWKQPSKAV